MFASSSAEPTSSFTGPVSTVDGAQLHVEDWGGGPPVVFTHGWTAGWEMWEYQMTALADRGLRCVGVDRRGCGGSTPGHAGFSYDQLADDLATVLDQLDLREVTLVTHSMAAGEAVRMIARHGSDRLARLALVSPTTPRLVQSPDNPHGIPQAVFDETIAALTADKPAFILAAAPAFFGGPDAVSDELMRWGVGLAQRASLRTSIELTLTNSKTDSRSDLATVTVPTLIIHGDADVSAPLESCGRPTAAAITGSTLEVYEGGPHGLPLSRRHADRLARDLISFVGTASSEG
jgi:pimeloyl-ACP methyl ester carboxylesterase